MIFNNEAALIFNCLGSQLAAGLPVGSLRRQSLDVCRHRLVRPVLCLCGASGCCQMPEPVNQADRHLLCALSRSPFELGPAGS